MRRSGSLRRRVRADVFTMEKGQAASSFGGRLALAAVMALAAVWLFGLGPVFAQASATRSFDQSTVALGGTLVVTIAVADFGSLGAVTETLPEGFTFVSSSLPADEVQVDGSTLRFTLLGAGTTGFTYTVTAPMAEGSYRFEGTLRDSDRRDYTIGGASEVTVSVTAPEPTATPTPVPTATPTAAVAATPTPVPTATATSTPSPAGQTPSPTAAATPTPTAEPVPLPTAAVAATPTPVPTATATQAPTMTLVRTATPTPSPTASPTAATIPVVPVVPAGGGGGMPPWVIPVALVAVLLLLIAGIGVFITSRQG